MGRDAADVLIEEGAEALRRQIDGAPEEIRPEPVQPEPTAAEIAERILAIAVEIVGAAIGKAAGGDARALFEQNSLWALTLLRSRQPEDFSTARARIKAECRGVVSLAELGRLTTKRSYYPAPGAVDELFADVRKSQHRNNPPNPPNSPVARGNPPENGSNPPENDLNPPAGQAQKPKQYLTAQAVKPRLAGRFAFDSTAADWLRRSDTHWRFATDGEIARAVVPALAALHGDFSYSLLSAVTRFLAHELEAPAEEPDRHLLPCANGVLDLRDMTLTPHAPAQWLRWCLPYAFEPQAQCPQFLAWLDDVTDGKQDVQLILRAWLRAVVTGRADLQRYLELIGPGGSGKSTFLWVCEQLVGSENTVVTDLQTLGGRFETANLYRKRLCVVTDAGRFGGDVDVLKAITGQDAIRYEVKFKQAGASFVFGGMVMLAANEPVATGDLSSGLARRRVTIHFAKIVPAHQRDEGLKDKLRAELPGVLA